MKSPILFIFGTLTLFFASCTTEPTANISANKTEVEVDEVISFSNTSEDAASYLWEFGDGTTSTERAPDKAYSNAGNFTVRMTAYSKNEKKEDVASLAVTVGANEDYEGTYEGRYGGFVDEDGTLIIHKVEKTNEIVIVLEIGNDNIEVYATVSGNNITIPEQNISYMGFAGVIVGAGELKEKDITLDYTITAFGNDFEGDFKGTRKD